MYAFLYSNIEDSTFPHLINQMVRPFSPEREKFCMLPVNQLLHACLLTKGKKCNMLSLFLLIHMVESTIHQADCCGRLQTIRQFRRSDRKPSRLSFRLKEFITFACFPTSQHRGIYFPPFAKANGPPFSPERETFCMLSFS